ncbi:MAG: CRTAC1 family protein [Pirellulales bacterium]|nr:CRTAC1 family protein [Pirellulales bacterium]
MSGNNRDPERSLPAAGGIAAAMLLHLFTTFSAEPARAQILLRDVSRQTGITFRHTDGSSGRRYIMETVCCGLALFDYDGDGDVDVYFLNGAPLPGTRVDVPPRNALYRNDGGWRFTDVTARAGVGDTGFGLGVAVGDYDNDGDADLYLNNYGPNVMYRNNGDGTFTDVTERTGTANGDKVGAGVSFLDMDGDGDLDLYVSNYLKFSLQRHATTSFQGFPAYVGPTHFPPESDTLYRNNGDGTFTDVSVESGIAAHGGWGMGMVCGDYDNDGDTDVFVANDLCENYLFENDGTGKFKEVGLISGAGYDLSGQEQGSMGVDCGDYDNDGWLDFYQTSFQRQRAILFKNFGGGVLEDVSPQTGATEGTMPCVTWGNSFVDFDNDGDRDIFVACGHLHDNIELFDDTSTYFEPNLLMMNTGDGKFVDVSSSAGDGMAVRLSSRGAGFDDLDNDGDVDAVILNSRREPTILRNDSKSGNHWIQIRLRGVHGNRDGVGAHVKVVAGDLAQLEEVHSGRGYQSHYGTRLYFGLGNRNRIDRVEVCWIGGGRDVLQNVAVDRLITITEGAGLPSDPSPKAGR